MAAVWRNLGVLRFTSGGLLVFTAISGLLITLWLPRIRTQLQTAKNLRTAQATASLFASVERGDLTLTELANQLSKGASPNAVSYNHNESTTALNLAIGNGDQRMVQMLLEAGADPNLCVPVAPLQAALQRDVEATGYQQLVRLLLNAGADLRSNSLLVDLILEKRIDGCAELLKQRGIDYGLREMCIVGDLALMKEHLTVPIQQESTQVRAYKGTSTLLGIALRCSHAEIANWLLQSGASISVGDEHHRASALHFAAIGNCREMLAPLVLAHCDINVGDVTGDTALNYAIPSSDPETIVALLDLGANANQFNNYLGIYPIHQAAMRYYRAQSQSSDRLSAERIVLALLRSGADVNQCDAQGRTATDLTYEYRNGFEKLVASGSAVEQ
jgi:ankyrin repeat protein